MKRYLRASVKIFTDYFTGMFLYFIFLNVFSSFAGENLDSWYTYYSMLFFIIVFYLIYKNMKAAAMVEKNAHTAYPLKGLVCGLLGFSPYILFEIFHLFVVLNFINLNNEVAESVILLIYKIIFGPVIFIAEAFPYPAIGYILSTLAVPCIALLGYAAGYYGIELIKIKGKKDKKQKALK